MGFNSGFKGLMKKTTNKDTEVVWPPGFQGYEAKLVSIPS